MNSENSTNVAISKNIETTETNNNINNIFDFFDFNKSFIMQYPIF